MTRRDGREGIRAEIPLETKDAMRDEEDPYWKVIDKAVKMYLGLDEGSTEHAITRMIDQLDEQLDVKHEERDQLEQEIEDLEQRREDLVQKREDIREKKQSHRERLDDILDEMLVQSEKTVLAWMNELKEAAAEEYGSTSTSNIERVVGDLRSRRDERDLAIPYHRFKRSAGPPTPGASGQAIQADGGSELSAWEESLLESADDEQMEADD